MMDARFLQDGFDKCLAHAIEETGEFLAAAGKTHRFGPHSVNPLLPRFEQVSNLEWLRDEIDDLRKALDRPEAAAEQEFG